MRRASVLLLTLATLTACNSARDAPRNAALPTPSSSVSPAPRITLPPADPATARATSNGLLRQKDLGPDWSEYEQGGGTLKDLRQSGRIGCALQPNGTVDPQTIEAAVDSAIWQKGKTTRYATSSALNFADVAGAEAAIKSFLAPAWTQCHLDDVNAQAKAQPDGGNTSWRAADRDPAGTGGLEGVLRFQFQAVVDGETRDANGYEAVLLYRIGRTVLVVVVQGVAKSDDPKNIDAEIDREVNAATTKALNRLP